MDPGTYLSYISKRESLLIIGCLLLILGGYLIYLGNYLSYILMVIGVIIIGYTFGKEKAKHNDLNINEVSFQSREF
jgi:hypothetical protein